MATLPKSLHTVRILVAVARHEVRRNGGSRAHDPVADLSLDDALRAVFTAADIIGYPSAGFNDPLIHKAARQLAGRVDLAEAPAPVVIRDGFGHDLSGQLPS